MIIDGRSLLAVVAALSALFCFVVLALERRIHQTMPGLRLWALANLFLSVAAAAHMLQGHVPAWVPALAGNWTMLVGRAVSVAALRQFDHQPVPGAGLAVACGALMLAIAATLVLPEPRARAMIMVGGMAVLALWATHSLAVVEPPSISRLLTMVGMGGWGLANLWRLWTTSQLPDGVPVLDLRNSAVAAFFGALVVTDVLANVGFVLLITDRMHEWVLQLARTDHLTGALSRGALYTQGLRDLQLGRRQRTPTAAFIIDIDRFKAINDGHGHAAGDAVLRHVAQHGQAVLRCTDLFGRYGGDEFVAILPETDLHTAAAIAERLRVAVGEPLPGANPPPCSVTVSIGVAAVAPGCECVDDLIAEADRALYQAKGSGRNRIRVVEEGPAEALAGATPLRVVPGRS